MTLLDWFILAALLLLSVGAYTYLVIAESRGTYSGDDAAAFGAFLFWAGVVLSVGTGFVVLIHHSEAKACRDTAQSMDREHEWSSWTGCLIRTDTGELVPEDRLRFNQTGEIVNE